MWKEIIKTEQDKPYFKELQIFLDKEYKDKEIFPKKEDIYSAFSLTPFHNVKVVIIGQDPYHGNNQAHGLAFSVLKGNKIPPSLRNIYKEMNNDIGFDIPNHGFLNEWAEEGILLMNTILTVEAHKPLSHKNKGWEIFTTHILEKINNDSNPKVFVLWGNNAMKKEVLLTNPKHLIIKTSHPSPLSARHSFEGSKMFSKINAFLIENRIKPIDFAITKDTK
jgi:uracil-DNA glycosylase